MFIGGVTVTRADSVPPLAELSFSRFGLALTEGMQGGMPPIYIVSHWAFTWSSQHNRREDAVSDLSLR